MSEKYESLYALMEEDQKARQYFMSLPDYVQDQMKDRADHINSFASLKDYSENLLRGDD